MRIVIIWVNIPNYMAAAIKKLATMGCELLVIQINSNDDSNKVFKFNETENVRYVNFSELKKEKKEIFLINQIIAFKPRFLLLSFYNRGLYYKIAKLCKKAKISIVAASDSYFEGSFRQIVRIILSRLGFHKNYNAIFVPGYRAFQYAKQLSFKENKIIQGLYSCDDVLFRDKGIKKHESYITDWPHVFIYTGQLIYRKGFDTLLKAYNKYRQKVHNPWELWVIGDGPLKNLTKGKEGVTYYNSLSAENCAKKYEKAGCFILPSIIEHWGVVLHEATCSGIPIIASSSCGATVELVQSYHNGLLIPHSDVTALVDAMCYISNDDKLARSMGKNSLEMSLRYSSSLVANKIKYEIPYVLDI